MTMTQEEFEEAKEIMGDRITAVGWISVNEKMPSPHNIVLCAVKSVEDDETYLTQKLGYFCDGMGNWYKEGEGAFKGSIPIDVIYWMPLPEYPELKSDD